MARRKNVKRIDPRYFLHETVNRNDDGSALEEELMDWDAVRAVKGAFTKKPKPYAVMSDLRSVVRQIIRNIEATGKTRPAKDFLDDLDDEKMREKGGVRVGTRHVKDPEEMIDRTEMSLDRNPFWETVFDIAPDKKDEIIKDVAEWAAKWFQTGHDAMDMMPYLTKLITKKLVPELEEAIAGQEGADAEASEKYKADKAAKDEENRASFAKKEAVWEKISDEVRHNDVQGEEAGLVANTLEAVYPRGLDLWITIASNSSNNKDIRHGQWDGQVSRGMKWEKVVKQGRQLAAVNWYKYLPDKAATKVKSIISDFISGDARPSYDDVEDSKERYQSQEKSHGSFGSWREE